MADRKRAVLVLLMVSSTLVSSSLVSSSYWDERAQFLQQEASRSLGSRVKLSPAEEVVNALLMDAKRRELSAAVTSGASRFPPATHFFHAKEDIDQSDVFHLIRDLPKGAALHGHDSSMASLAFVVSNLTRRAGLFGCVTPGREAGADDVPLALHRLRFSSSARGPPPGALEDCEWAALEAVRSRYGAPAVDQWLARELSLVVEDPRGKYPNVDVAWDYFNKIFEKIDGLFTYKPVFEDYYKRILAELQQDNVIYLELRGTLPKLYDTDGNEWVGAEVLKIYKEATEEFLKENSDFFGAKFIYGPIRNVNDSVFNEDLQTVTALHAAFPHFLAGFDLVGQEDKGRPLKDFVDGLLSLPSSLKFFFHAGETNWQGLTDENLIDAVLLNTTRLGHGYAILKHPLVMQMAKDRGVAVEVNPISNQVLRLVEDLRNHPAGALFANDFPVVVSCDDPCFWNASGLSYDFYEAFMGLASADADLRFLKQLALNSIAYSSMPDDEKARALDMWQSKWNQFIEKTIDKHKIRTGLFTNEVS